MNVFSLKLNRLSIKVGALLLAVSAASALHAQTCLTADDMDAATKTALLTTAQSYFDMVTRGDAATLRQNAISTVAADFSGIETAIKDNQSNFSGVKPVPRPPFLSRRRAPRPWRMPSSCAESSDPAARPKTAQYSKSRIFLLDTMAS